MLFFFPKGSGAAFSLTQSKIVSLNVISFLNWICLQFTVMKSVCMFVIYIYIWKVQEEEQKEVLSWKLDWITSWSPFQPEFSYGLSEVAYKY